MHDRNFTLESKFFNFLTGEPKMQKALQSNFSLQADKKLFRFNSTASYLDLHIALQPTLGCATMLLPLGIAWCWVAGSKSTKANVCLVFQLLYIYSDFLSIRNSRVFVLIEPIYRAPAQGVSRRTAAASTGRRCLVLGCGAAKAPKPAFLRFFN